MLPRSIGTAVIGGGIVGSCIAGFLADEGADVLLLDEGRGGGSSTNAGSLHVQMQSRFMRLYPESVPRMERQLPLYTKAVDFWKALETRLGTSFELKITGGLMVAESAEQMRFLAEKAARERALGLEVEMLDRPALGAIAPYLGPHIVGAEFCANEGKLNPLLCNASIREWIVGRGVSLAEGVNVEIVDEQAAAFRLRTSQGTIKAGRVVLACGAGVAALAAGLGVNIPARPEPLHMNITESAPPLIGHLVQHADKMVTLKQLGTGQVVIGGGWPARLGERNRVEVELSSLIGNTRLAQHIVPALAPLRILRTWGGINTSVDGTGVLGPVPSLPGLFIAIPGDAGYTLGPLSAWLVAQTILGRDSGQDLEPFRTGRFQ